MPIGDERQVRWRRVRTYRPVIANGPPDNETLDRRRVDPPAGCRAAAEPASVPQRRSVDDFPAPTPAIRPATDGRFFVSTPRVPPGAVSPVRPVTPARVVSSGSRRPGRGG